MKIPVCFNNVIGIKDACDAKGLPLPPPSSGNYISELAGITLKAASKVANGNYINGQELLTHCIDFAASGLFNNLRNQIATNYRLDSILESNRFGNFSADFQNYKNNDRGVRIFRNFSYNWIGKVGKYGYDTLQYLRLNRIHFLCADTVKGLIITVTDSEFGTYTYSINTVANEVFTLETDLVLRSHTVSITTNNQNVRVNVGDDFCGCTSVGCCGRSYDTFFGFHNKIQIQGWNKTEATAYKSNFGIVPELSLECSYDGLLCSLKPQLGDILLYAAGIEFINQITASDRINEYTSFGSRENAEARKAIWVNGNKTRITILLDSLQKMFNNVKDSECITCKQLAHTYSI